MAELSQEPVPAPADLFQWSLSTAVIAMLSRSCLLPAIWAYLRNDSVLDISQHVEVYEAVVQIVAALALSAQSASGEEEIEIRALLSDPTSDCSVLSMLKKLFECVSAYLTRITVESNEARLQNLNIEQSNDSDDVALQTREEGLMRLAPLITVTCSLLSEPTIAFFSKGAYIPYHYDASLSLAGTSSSFGKRTRRLAQEIVTLSNSLPLSASSCVFVRAAEERLDVMKVSHKFPFYAFCAV
ncbi:unnamed protein product [Gongylonema pulchrum]|uniref:Uncharacterized protein n=1 Tax=Gongylonema pulchrum TaxID=637853 RepID=A0A183ELU3_9BILA|nr:unnamed protein product [Gongylonema pulchrum]